MDLESLDFVIERGIQDVSSTLEDIWAIGMTNSGAREYVVGGGLSLDIVFEMAPE